MIVLLCGNIGSGKEWFMSTLAHKGYFTVSGDAIVRMFHGGHYTLCSRKNWGHYKHVELSMIVAGVCDGRKIVVDRPCHMAIVRDRFIRLANEIDTPIVAVTFPRDTPLAHAERRFKTHPDGHTLDDWLTVAARHHREWEEPHLDEGFDNVLPVEVALDMVNAGKF